VCSSDLTLKLDGSESYDVAGELTPGGNVNLSITRVDGELRTVTTKCRIDTQEELSIYAAGGVLQRFAQDFLEATQSA